jgi:predicted CopG family antitoxin
MHTIEVDFDVFKQLTVRRNTEDVSYNDVIRDLLGLGQKKASAAKENSAFQSDLVAKGVRFPVGTDFQANYKGQTYTGRIDGGKLVINGKSYSSLSAAAVAITGSPVNGWRFWKCRLPGSSS